MIPAHRRVTWLELFFDLAFVGAVAQVGAPLGSEYTPAGLLRYGFLFLLIWWAWIGHTNFATRFESDDHVQRVLTLAQIFVVAVMAVNAKEPLDSTASAGFSAAYAVLRLMLVAQYWRAGRAPETRAFTRLHAAGYGLAAVLWGLSAVVAVPLRFWLWGVALVLDLGTPAATARLAVRLPPHGAHLPERYGLFTIILIGESMLAVMKGMESQEGWSVPAASSAFLGMTISFLVWWWYFDGARGATERSMRPGRQAPGFMAWSFAHVPFYLGLVVTAVGVEHVIRIAPEGHLDAGEVSMLCGAAALLMAAIVTIEATSQPALRRRAASWFAMRYAVSALPAAAAPLVSSLPPVLLVAGIAALVLAQLVMASAASLLRVPFPHERMSQTV